MPSLSWENKHRPDITPQYSPLLYEEWGSESLAQLYCGNNLDWLRHAKTNQTQVSLIYLDPPFCSQANYRQHFDINGQRITVNAFGDIFTVDDYLQFIYERVIFLKDVLKESGSILLHCDHQQSHHLRAILDEVFGANHFRNEIIWHYTGGGRAKRYFSHKHDSIFWYSKGPQWTFNADPIRVPYKESSGYAKGGIKSRSGKVYHPNPKGTIPDDTWDIPMLNPLANERNGYPTQKPLTLLNRLILALSNPGDTVLDPFVGSGTTGVAALQNGRRFIGLDQNWNAIHCTQQRLLQETPHLRVTHNQILPSTIEQITIKSRAPLTIEAQDKHGQAIPFQQIRGRTTANQWTLNLTDPELSGLRVVALDGSSTDFDISNTETVYHRRNQFFAP